jgi:hypothetical protein
LPDPAKVETWPKDKEEEEATMRLGKQRKQLKRAERKRLTIKLSFSNEAMTPIRDEEAFV